MHFNIVTIFPDLLDSYFSKGMIRIALEKKLIKIKYTNLRDFSVDAYGSVDDKPYGGGPGQIMRVEPIYKALKKTKKKNSKVILLSAKGKTWNQQLAQEFSKEKDLIFICPRYEGHDERILEFVDEEISIGNFVLTGGELGAGVIIDSITRLIPGVLGNLESIEEESHSKVGQLEYPQYTRPEVFTYKKRKGLTAKKIELKVPDVLLSGHHEKIKSWRSKNHTTFGLIKKSKRQNKKFRTK